MKVSEQVLPNAGMHTGIVAYAKEEERDYGDGPEAKVILGFTATDQDGPVSSLEKVFNATLGMQSGLGRAIVALGYDLTPGGDFDLQTLVEAPCAFEVVQKSNGFLDIPSASIGTLTS